MFAVIYKFKLQAHQEELYQSHWHKVARFFIENRGAIGSCLHKGENGLWVAYSRWPDKAMRDASWPGEASPAKDFPEELSNSIKIMQAIKQENKNWDNYYEELCLDIVNDLL
ncbi:MAG: hypothetical protein H0U70_09760 [Tatlockia sp.]|nr:hypothetical protein [Tatlockia sp.]